MSEKKAPAAKPKEASLSTSEAIEITQRTFSKFRTRKEVEKVAVQSIGRALAALDAVSEQRDQLAGFNKVLKDEGKKLVDYANMLSAEVEKLRAENASLQKLLDEATRPTTEKPPPIVGKCQNCQHDGHEWHNNPSRVCSREACPCLKFVSPVSA